MAKTDYKSKVFIDLAEVVRVLCAVGFNIRHIDTSEQSDVTPTGHHGQERRGGCRVVVTCTTSGLRAVLETVGEECGCTAELLGMASDNQSADEIITPFSEPASLMLRELLIKLTKHGGENVKSAAIPIIDLSDSKNKRKELQELKHESHLEEHVGLGSVSTLSGSSDKLSTSSGSDRPQQKDKEISTCSSIPAVRDYSCLGVPPNPSKELLTSQQVSEPSCGTASSVMRKEDNIEYKLKLAAACIQEVLEAHRRDSAANRTASSVFKVPSVPVGKRKTTTNFPQGESTKHVTGKSIKPRPLTPLPAKKAKLSVSEKSSTPRISNPLGIGRTNPGISHR